MPSAAAQLCLEHVVRVRVEYADAVLVVDDVDHVRLELLEIVGTLQVEIDGRGKLQTKDEEETTKVDEEEPALFADDAYAADHGDENGDERDEEEKVDQIVVRLTKVGSNYGIQLRGRKVQEDGADHVTNAKNEIEYVQDEQANAKAFYNKTHFHHTEKENLIFKLSKK